MGLASVNSRAMSSSHSSWSGKIASSFAEKYRKKVRRPTPAASAIWSTVVASYPLVRNSSIAEPTRARRTCRRPAAVRPLRRLGARSAASAMSPDLTEPFFRVPAS